MPPARSEASPRRYSIRAVTRAVDLLDALGQLPASDLSSLARAVRLDPSTTLRYLDSLRQRGLVRQQPDGTYQLGARLFELGSSFARGLSIWDQANDLARSLAAKANETASVGVLDEGQVLYIAIANGQRELGIQSSPGVRHPAHCTALGKALLAAAPPSVIEATLSHRPLVRLTDKTITDFAELHRELERTGRRGYSIDDEERTEGVLCIGAAISDHMGRIVAAISISGPKFRMVRHGIEPQARMVIAAARDASAGLGHITTASVKHVSRQKERSLR